MLWGYNVGNTSESIEGWSPTVQRSRTSENLLWVFAVTLKILTSQQTDSLDGDHRDVCIVTEKFLENVPGDHPLVTLLVRAAQPTNLGASYCACLGPGTLGGGRRAGFYSENISIGSRT